MWQEIYWHLQEYIAIYMFIGLGCLLFTGFPWPSRSAARRSRSA